MDPLESTRQNGNLTKQSLDMLIKRFNVQHVGWGYSECITNNENVCEFLNALTEIGITVLEVRWWCFCQDWIKYGVNEETGCPHGGGGPVSVYYDGCCFSEMYHLSGVKFTNNADVLNFLLNEWPTHEDYLPCLVPAFDLDVPDDWKNVSDLAK